MEEISGEENVPPRSRKRYLLACQDVHQVLGIIGHFLDRSVFEKRFQAFLGLRAKCDRNRFPFRGTDIDTLQS